MLTIQNKLITFYAYRLIILYMLYVRQSALNDDHCLVPTLSHVHGPLCWECDFITLGTLWACEIMEKNIDSFGHISVFTGNIF